MRKSINSKIKSKLILIALLFSNACSEIQDTTTIATVTGGAIGAGVGAIVGSQVGNAGAGLAIGMAAGAGTGAAIGNMIEDNEKKILANEERLNRQEQQLRAQQNEINNLRGVERDTFKSEASANISTVKFATPEDIARKKIEMQAGSTQKAKLNTASAFSDSNYYSESTPSGTIANEITNSTSSFTQSIEQSLCSSEQKQNAQLEIQKADRANDSADKLFHLRRALRLCSDNATAHSKLGHTYLAMNRNDDAKNEFLEALRLNPSEELAQQGMDKLQKNTTKTDTSLPKLPSSNRY